MTSSIATILSVGAAGKFAGLVVPELAKRGVKVRGLIRHVDDAEKVRKHGAAEVAIGDLRDRASMDPELRAELAGGSEDGNLFRTQASAMKRMFDWYDKHALLGNALILRAILDREPRTLRSYFEQLAAGSKAVQ